MKHLLFLFFTFSLTFSSAQNDVLIQKLKNSKFRIRTNLTPGEYAFVYKGTTPQFSSNPIFLSRLIKWSEIKFF